MATRSRVRRAVERWLFCLFVLTVCGPQSAHTLLRHWLTTAVRQRLDQLGLVGVRVTEPPWPQQFIASLRSGDRLDPPDARKCGPGP